MEKRLAESAIITAPPTRGTVGRGRGGGGQDRCGPIVKESSGPLGGEVPALLEELSPEST